VGDRAGTRQKRRAGAAAIGVLALVVTACSTSSQDVRDAALRSIRGTLSRQLGMGELEASCDKPDSNDAGTTFACQGLTADGRQVRFTARVLPGDRVQVVPVNVLTVENLHRVEAEAARILTQRVGQELPASAISCGDKPMIAESKEPFICTLTDPGTGTRYDTQITLDDIDKPTELLVQVASAPRA
jgi:hypothetical protein